MEWGKTGNCSTIGFFVPAGSEWKSHEDRLSDKEKVMWGYLMVKGRIFLETKDVLSKLTAFVLQTLVHSSTVSTLNIIPLNLLFKQNLKVEKQESVYEALFGFLGHWPWFLYVLSESLARVGFQSSLSQMWTYNTCNLTGALQGNKLNSHITVSGN